MIRIRELNRQSEAEILLVAQPMRETMIEVLGEKEGVAIYSMDWLIDRVRWHLDPNFTTGRVFLAEDESGYILGHAIARTERAEDGALFGYFSTLFVEKGSRGKGIAKNLIRVVENWFLELGLPKMVYNTAERHSAILRLLSSHGFRITHLAPPMVQLTKALDRA